MENSKYKRASALISNYWRFPRNGFEDSPKAPVRVIKTIHKREAYEPFGSKLEIKAVYHDFTYSKVLYYVVFDHSRWPCDIYKVNIGSEFFNKFIES